MNGIQFNLTMDYLEVKSVYEDDLIIKVCRHTRNVYCGPYHVSDPTRRTLTRIALEIVNMFDGEVAE